MIFITHLRFYPYLCTRKSIKAFRCKKYKTNDPKSNEKRISTLLCLLALAMTSMQAKDYNVKDFGAIGNGKVLDHHAINTAIDSCVAHGGGRVVLPAGTYLCGSIRMKSHVELHLMAGSKILAAPASMKAYDEAEFLKAQLIRTADILILKTASSMPSTPMMYPSQAEV